MGKNVVSLKECVFIVLSQHMKTVAIPEGRVDCGVAVDEFGGIHHKDNAFTD